MPSSFRCVVLLLLASWPLGCNQEQSISEHRMRAAVREYNLALPRAYAEQRLDPLYGKATQRELSRVAILIMRLKQHGQALESRQTRVRVEKVTHLDAKRGQVVTRELWLHRRRPIRAPKALPPMKQTRYRVRYHLSKVKGRWLVSKLENLESVTTKPKR